MTTTMTRHQDRSRFPDDLTTRKVWGQLVDEELTARFRYICNDTTVIDVPKGYVTDGASIPRLAWRLVGGPWSGLYKWAAVVHDYTYTSSFFGHDGRQRADEVFLEAMYYSGVCYVKRQGMYVAVRLAGGKHYHKHCCENAGSADNSTGLIV